MAYLPRFSLFLTAALIGGGMLLPGGVSRAVAATTASPTPAASPAPTPVKPTSFDAVTARLDKGGSFYLYLSTAQWLDHLSTNIIGWRDLYLGSLPKDPKNAADRRQAEQGFDVLAKLVKQSGIEEITGYGASSLAQEPGVNRNVSFVHHDKGSESGQLLDTAFGSAPHALNALDFLPADTAYGHYGDLDLSRILRTIYDALEASGIPEIKKEMDGGLTQFQAMTGMSVDDVLQSLGGAEGEVLTLDPVKKITVPLGDGKQMTLPLPRLALIVRMNDDKIFARVDQVLGAIPMITKVDEDGLRMRTMPYPAAPNFTVRATVAQWDKFLVIASDDSLVRDMVAAQKSGHGLKATPEFAKLSAGMPTEGNGFTVLTREFGETVKTVQGELMKENNGAQDAQMAWVQKYYAGQNVGSTYSVSAHVDDGWLSVSKGAKSMSGVLVPLALVPAALAAGVAMPIYQSMQAKGEAKGSAAKSESNVKQIALACKLYAGDNDGKFPPTLDALVPSYVSDESIFVSPYAPDESAGYTYTPGLKDDSPANDVLVEDKFSGKEHQRVVAHVDGSAAVTRVP